MRAGRGHLRRHQRQDGAGDPHADRREGHRAARLRARRVRRRRPDARRLPGPRARHPRGDRAALPRRVLRLGHAGDRDPQGHSAARTSRRSPTLDHADLAAPARGARGGGLRRAWPTRASRRQTGRVEHALDMRYSGPGVHADHPAARAPASRCATASPTRSSGRFHEAHQTRFGHANPGAPVEFVVVRTTALGDLGRVEPAALPDGADDGHPPGAGAERRLRPHRARGDRASAATTSAAAPSLEGPAIVSEQTATTVVPPGARADRRRVRRRSSCASEEEQHDDDRRPSTRSPPRSSAARSPPPRTR